MQRLPPHRIPRAHEVGEIIFEKHPAAAGLPSRDEAALGAASHLLWMHVKEGGGAVKIEGSHSGTRVSAEGADPEQDRQ